jgi:hypothetical protein
MILVMGGKAVNVLELHDRPMERGNLVRFLEAVSISVA